MEISPQDRDLIIRTVIGEAADEPVAGQAGVAYSVINRLKSGDYGKSIPQVLFAPKQYEPWNTRSKDLMSYSQDNPTYQRVGQVVDGIITGKIKDPTNGATHFANVDIVKQRGNTSALKWINDMQDVIKIGSHTFGKADAGRQMAENNYDDLINKYGGSTSQSKSDTTSYDDLAAKYGNPEAKIGVTAEAEAKPQQRMIGNRPLEPSDLDFSKKDTAGASPSELYERTIKPVMELPTKTYEGFTPGQDFTNQLSSAKKLASEGVQDIQASRSATGVGKLGLAGLTALTSPLTPITEETSKAVTNITGNKDIGDKAGIVAASAVPVAPAVKLMKGLVPSEKAINSIVDAIGSENLAEVVQRMRSNPRLSLYDISPGVQQMAQKLITTPGPHQNEFVKSIENRAGTAKDAITTAVDTHLGPAVDVAQKLDSLKAAARTTGQNVINPLVEGAKLPADVTKVVDMIDDLIATGGPVEKASLRALKGGEAPSLPLSDAQKELWAVRQKLRGNWPDRDNMFMDIGGEQGAHNLQSQLRSLAEDLTHSSSGTERRLGRKIYDIRNDLVNSIDDSAKGYKDALRKYASDKDVEEAFMHGTTIFKNGNLEDGPDFWRRWIGNASDAEKNAAKEGARIAIDQQLRAYANGARKGMNIPEVDFNVEKLSELFGKKEAEALFKKLRDERDIANSNTKMIGNSQTAMRMKNDARVDLPDRTTFKGESLIPPAALEVGSFLTTGTVGPGTALYLASKGAHALKETGSIQLAKARNSAITKLLTATGPERDQFLNILSQHIPSSSLTLKQKAKLALPTVFP